MNDIEIKLELDRQLKQQQQWHDDFNQRGQHWAFQRYFWVFMGGVATITVFTGIATLTLKYLMEILS